MKYEQLRRNLDKTLGQMKEQTGKEPGGPTGLCSSVAAGALSGEFKFPRDAQQTLPLIPVNVNTDKSKDSVLPDVLMQDKLAIDAVQVSGQLKDDWGHVINIVPEDGKPPYHIVDSLLPKAMKTVETTEEASKYVNDNFHPETIKFAIVPNEKEILQRSNTSEMEQIKMGDGIVARAPVKNLDFSSSSEQTVFPPPDNK